MSQSFDVELGKILDDYVKEVDAVTNECIKETATEAVAKLKSTSPKGKRGKYARSWTMTAEQGYTGTDYIVHNKEGSLTHLLENGHVIRNQYGTYGRTRAIKHIEPVEQWAEGELERRITGRLG